MVTRPLLVGATQVTGPERRDKDIEPRNSTVSLLIISQVNLIPYLYPQPEHQPFSISLNLSVADLPLP